MARFSRDNEHTELVFTGSKIVEGTRFGLAEKALHDARAARIAYYLRTSELLADGWIRTSRFADDLPYTEDLPFPVDDDDALGVYRDWLIERGDPRGELAALRAADKPDLVTISSLEKTRGAELFGPFAMLPRTWREHAAFGWRRGWIDEIVLGLTSSVAQPREILHAALHAPMARFARWVTLDRFYEHARGALAPCACLDRVTFRQQD